MHNLDIKATIETGYLQETESSVSREYVLLLVTPVVSFVLGLLVFNQGNFRYKVGEGWWTFTAILFFLSLVFNIITFFKIKSVNKLVIIDTVDIKETTRKKIKSLIHQQNWITITDNRDLIIAETRSKISHGCEITLILKKGLVAINVRRKEGFRGRIPFTFGKRRKILKLLREKLNAT